MTPRVSILIPCFNSERYLPATLDSALGQTWPNIEVIVVDDGSSDGSPGIVDTYATHGVKLIRQANAGACAARNRALAEATGDFIQFLDADDLIDRDKITLQMARLEGETGSVASAEWGRFWSRPDEVAFAPEPNWEDLEPVEWLTRSRHEGLGMLLPGLWLCPRAVIEAAGPWDESLSRSGNDDGEYFTRVVLAADRVLFCPGARCRYRSGLAGSLSRSKHWPSTFRVIELCESHVRAREDSERVRRGFALSWQHLAHAAWPYDRPTAMRALAHARALHTVRVRPGGGPAFKILSRLIGWRLARQLQVASGRP